MVTKREKKTSVWKSVTAIFGPISLSRTSDPTHLVQSRPFSLQILTSTVSRILMKCPVSKGDPDDGGDPDIEPAR
jgi:hypothetical protein